MTNTRGGERQNTLWADKKSPSRFQGQLGNDIRHETNRRSSTTSRDLVRPSWPVKFVRAWSPTGWTLRPGDLGQRSRWGRIGAATAVGMEAVRETSADVAGVREIRKSLFTGTRRMQENVRTYKRYLR